MGKKSIEFQPVSKKSLTVPVRKSFRVPVPKESSVRLTILEKDYPLTNISTGGVAIFSNESFEFEIDHVLFSCTLSLGDIRLENLTGKVVQSTAAGKGRFQYGISWLDLNDRDKGALNEFLERMKNETLQNSDRNVDKI